MTTSNNIRQMNRNFNRAVESIKEEMHNLINNVNEICGQTGWEMENDSETAAKTGNELFANSLARLEELKNELVRLQINFNELAASYAAN